nr:hypothetical protein [uncultured archaeon]
MTCQIGDEEFALGFCLSFAGIFLAFLREGIGGFKF